MNNQASIPDQIAKFGCLTCIALMAFGMLWNAITGSGQRRGYDYVATPGNTMVFVCRDERASDELSGLIRRNDTQRLTTMAAAGRVYTVASGTKVEVVSRGLVTSEVRILEGGYAGKTGLVSSEFLKR